MTPDSGTTEGRLGVDDPVDLGQRVDVLDKGGRLLQVGPVPVKAQFAAIEGLSQFFEKESAKETGEDFDRKKETGAAGNPFSLWGDTAAWDHTMQMRMMIEVLSPGVEDSEEADLSAEMLWIAGDGEERLGSGAEEHVVEGLLVL